jgi:Tfp pilus assembly protein PilN
VRAVNLIPDDARRGWRNAGGRSGGSVYVFLGTLAIALVLVTVYVLASNRVADQKGKIASLQAEATQAQGAAARLEPYVEFAKLAQARTVTVREIASSRFDWHAALAGLSRVVPANTSLQSLTGTVVPGVTIGGSSAGGQGANLRGDIAAPAFELAGCSDSQDDVARLISRLRLIDGVTRVSLENSTQAASGQPGAAVSSGTSGGAVGCKKDAPSFNLVVFFTPLADAGAQGVTTLGSSSASTATTAGGSK